MEIFDPTGGPARADHTPAPAHGRDTRALLGRARLGVIENGNANADFVLERLADGLVKALGWDPDIVWVRKPTAGEGATAEDLDHLTRTCGLVLAGTAD